MRNSPSTLIQNKKEVPLEFNNIARRYDLATRLSQGYQKDLQLSADRMNLRGNEVLADLCCGTGKSTIACLKNLPEGEIIAIDNSEGMLNVAREKILNGSTEGNVRFVKMDVMDLDLDSDSLDAIFMAYGIRNMPDFKLCADNLLRVLKPGGKVCFHEYSINKSLFSKIYWNFLGYFFIIPFAGITTGSTKIFRYLIKSVNHFLSPDEFVDLLQKAGFEKISHLPLTGWRKPILHTFTAQKPG